MKSLATEVSTALRNKNIMLATAESCTGGWVAKIMTDIAGSSSSFDRGFVTYSNAAKQDMLGVSTKTLNEHGAVSEPVVEEMATGTLKNSLADISLSISGIAGPGGGTVSKPVGTVCFAWAMRNGGQESTTQLFSGDRESIRQQAVIFALRGVLDMLQQS